MTTFLVIPNSCYTFAPRQATSSCRTSPGWKHSKDKAVEQCAWRIFLSGNMNPIPL